MEKTFSYIIKKGRANDLILLAKGWIPTESDIPIVDDCICHEFYIKTDVEDFSFWITGGINEEIDYFSADAFDKTGCCKLPRGLILTPDTIIGINTTTEINKLQCKFLLQDYDTYISKSNLLDMLSIAPDRFLKCCDSLGITLEELFFQ